LGDRIAVLLDNQGPRVQLIAAAALVFIMNALYPDDKSLGGFVLGFAGGYILMRRDFSFSASAPVRGKKPSPPVLTLRCLLGLAGTALIYGGLRLVLPGEDSFFADYPRWGRFSPYYDLGRFIRYGLAGFWASAGAPRLFLRLGLAENGKPEAP
jgi:hypothetical protein